MAKIAGYSNLSNINLYSQESAPSMSLGTRVGGGAGGEFRYVKAGGSALVVGNVLQSAAYTTTWNALSLAVVANVGDTVIKLTNAAAAVTADKWKWGTLTVDAGTGIGQTFTILGNTADLTGGTITFTVAEPVRVALAIADSKLTPRPNPCDGVIACPTTLTGTVVGVAIYPIALGYYGWIQSKGVAAVTCDASVFAIGSEVGVPGATAGTIGVNVAGTGKSNHVGRAMQAASSAHDIPVDLTL